MAEYSSNHASYVCGFLESLVFGSGTWEGRPFVLLPWQREPLEKFYGTLDLDEDAGQKFRQYQYLYLEIPKKNGKTELAAALGLYHLVGDGEQNPQVYICAADKDNASICFNAMLNMVNLLPWLKRRLDPVESRREIHLKDGSGFIKVLSADAYSKHGYNASCVIFDELHAQPNRKLWDIMTFGAGSGRKQPVWIVLTTAGDDPDRGSIGWEIHEKAVGVRDARQLRRIQAEGGDPHQVLSLRKVDDGDMEQAQQELLERDLPNWLPILYGITAMFGDDPEDLKDIDIWDENLWYLCNPSLGRHLSIRTLRLEAREARSSEAGEKLFRWLRLNQWISVKAVGWLPLTLYDKCQWGPSRKADREKWLEQLRGKLCYGGVDLSTSRDMTAFVLLFPPQPGLEAAVILPYIWRPKGTVLEAERRDHVPYRDWERAGFLRLCEGNTIDYGDVENTIREAKELYDLRLVGFDPYLSRTITQRLSAHVEVIEIPQDLKNMSPAMKEIDTMMEERQLLHIHNTCFRWTFGNVRIYSDGNGNIKPLKNRSIGRIDPTVASIIVVAVWMIARAQKATLADAMRQREYHL